MWVLTEELSLKMTLEVASQLFELYLSLADIQRFWSSILGRWMSYPTYFLLPPPSVPCPTCTLPATVPLLPPVPLPDPPFLPLLLPHLLSSPTCFLASSRKVLEQKPKSLVLEALPGAL